MQDGDRERRTSVLMLHVLDIKQSLQDDGKTLGRRNSRVAMIARTSNLTTSADVASGRSQSVAKPEERSRSSNRPHKTSVRKEDPH